jgi:hypothetical protein
MLLYRWHYGQTATGGLFGMRWDHLFADLEGQADALATLARAGEVEERTRYEVGQLGFVDRIRLAVGLPVRLRCRGGLLATGTVVRVGAGWLLLDEGAGRECLVALPAILSVSGLSRLSGVPGSAGVVASRLGLRHALREVARDRSPATIHLTDGAVVEGTIDRIGADFVDVAVHAAGEPRRNVDVRGIVVVPIDALSAIHRDR